MFFKLHVFGTPRVKYWTVIGRLMRSTDPRRSPLLNQLPFVMAAGYLRDTSAFRQDGDDPTPSYGRMLYDYDASDKVGLPMAAQAGMTILQRGADWYRITDGVRVGFVPATYVELVFYFPERSIVIYLD